MSFASFSLAFALFVLIPPQKTTTPTSAIPPAPLSPLERYVVWTNKPDCSFAAVAPSDPQTDDYDRYISTQQFQCSGTWNHGVLIRNIRGPELGVLVQCEEAAGHFDCIAFFKNLSDRRLDVDPEAFWIQEVLPAEKRLNRIPPAKLAHSIERRTRWANALAAFGAAFATQPISGTATSASGDEYAIRAKTPDTAAQAQTAAENSERTRASNEQAASLMEAALEHHTLFPQADVAGFIFFERDKHMRLMRVHVPIDGTDYVFVFTPPKKR